MGNLPMLLHLKHLDDGLPMDWDALVKLMVTVNGLGLVGMMVVRTNARGKMRIIGLEHGPLFHPRWAGTAKWLALAFAIGVLVVAQNPYGL
jgi:hypothetical protein